MPKEPYNVIILRTDMVDGKIPPGTYNTSAYSPFQAFTQILSRYGALYLRDRFTDDDILRRVRKVVPEEINSFQQKSPYPYDSKESDSQPTQLSLNI